MTVARGECHRPATLAGSDAPLEPGRSSVGDENSWTGTRPRLFRLGIEAGHRMARKTGLEKTTASWVRVELWLRGVPQTA